MCPSCGKLMGIGNECPYCGADARAIGTRLKALSRASAREQHGTPFTFGLLVVMVGIYLASIAFGGVMEGGSGFTTLFSPTPDTQIRLGAMLPKLVDQGEWWRLITSNFLHWGALHLLMNGLAIWVLGRAYEHEVGSLQTFNLFMIAGLAGFAASYLLGGPNRLVVGASAGGFGLMGCIIGRRWMKDGNLRDPMTYRAIQFVVINFVLSAVIGADNLAHGGGLIAGVGVAFLQARYERARRAWLVVGIVLAGLVATSAVFAFVMPQHYVPQQVVERGRTCVVKASQAMSESGAVVIDEAEGALECLGQLPDMGTGQPSIDTITKGLKRALSGRKSGSLSDERQGLSELGRGLDAYVRWLTKEYGPASGE